MPGKPPEVLVFDLGGVLVDFRGFEELAKLSPADRGIDAVRERWLASPSVRAFESGKIDPSEFSATFVAEWGLEIAPEEFLLRFDAWAVGLYPGATELLAELVGRSRLACLSNANVIHAERYRSLLAPHFDSMFFSHELGLLKPDLEVFDVVANRLEAPPGRLILFDDSESNVRAARRAGWCAELVRGVSELRNALSRTEQSNSAATG